MAAKCLVIVMTVLAFISGCETDEEGKPTAEVKVAEVAITADNLSTITSKQWVLASMTTDGKDYALEDQVPTMTISAVGKIAGSASINKYFGTVEVDGKGNVKWPAPFGTTRMAGPENLMNQEIAFLAAIPKTEQISLKGATLTLSSKDGQTALVFGELVTIVR